MYRQLFCLINELLSLGNVRNIDLTNWNHQVKCLHFLFYSPKIRGLFLTKYKKINIFKLQGRKLQLQGLNRLKIHNTTTLMHRWQKKTKNTKLNKPKHSFSDSFCGVHHNERPDNKVYSQRWVWTAESEFHLAEWQKPWWRPEGPVQQRRAGMKTVGRLWHKPADPSADPDTSWEAAETKHTAAKTKTTTLIWIC